MAFNHRLLVAYSRLLVASDRVLVASTRLLVATDRILDANNLLLLAKTRLLVARNHLLAVHNRFLVANNRIPVTNNRFWVTNNQLLLGEWKTRHRKRAIKWWNLQLHGGILNSTVEFKIPRWSCKFHRPMAPFARPVFHPPNSNLLRTSVASSP